MVIATSEVFRVMDEILTVREVAEYLKLSRTTIWRWCNEGKLQAFKVGRGWRIHRSEIDKITGLNINSPSQTEQEK
jgi:excisionase family DNA binding protein